MAGSGRRRKKTKPVDSSSLPSCLFQAFDDFRIWIDVASVTSAACLRDDGGVGIVASSFWPRYCSKHVFRTGLLRASRSGSFALALPSDSQRVGPPSDISW